MGKGAKRRAHHPSPIAVLDGGHAVALPTLRTNPLSRIARSVLFIGHHHHHRGEAGTARNDEMEAMGVTKTTCRANQ